MVQYTDEGILFDIDLVPGGIPPIIYISQYDVRRLLVARLHINGNDYHVPSGGDIEIKLEGTTNSHGFAVDASVDISSRNLIETTITEDMTAFSGPVRCKFRFTLSALGVTGAFSTAAFILDCDRAGVEAGTVIGAPGFEEQIQDAVDAYMEEHPASFELPSGGVAGQALLSDGADGVVWGDAGIPSAVKTALLNCFANVAWVSSQGQSYYNALESALNGMTPTPSPLPAAYQQVTYIEGNGNAHFTASFGVPTGYSVECKASKSSAPSGNQSQSVCGGRGAANAYRAYLSFSKTSDYIGCWYGGTNNYVTLANLYASPVESVSSFQTSGGESLNLTVKNASGEETATVPRSASTPIDDTPNLAVFWHGDSSNGLFSGKVYYIRVKDAGNSLYAQLIPCYRKSDNVVGMYETVRGAFYPSDTSTAFTKGADVS